MEMVLPVLLDTCRELYMSLSTCGALHVEFFTPHVERSTRGAVHVDGVDCM